MKTLRTLSILSLLSMISFAALADTLVKDCSFEVTNKQTKSSHTRTALLSTDFTNTLKFQDTTLSLRIDNQGQLYGTVNLQPNFLISGTAELGSFESAFDSGTILCGKSVKVSHLYFNKSNGYMVSTNPKVGPNNYWKTLSVFNLIQQNYCYVGQAAEVTQDLLDMPHIEAVKSSLETVSILIKYQECTESVGSIDDHECKKMVQKEKWVVMESCYYSPDSRN